MRAIETLVVLFLIQEEGVGNAELIRRKVSTQSEQSVTVQTSPQAHHHDKNKEKDREKEKGKKPVKTKFPPSPSVRRKKNGNFSLCAFLLKYLK